MQVIESRSALQCTSAPTAVLCVGSSTLIATSDGHIQQVNADAPHTLQRRFRTLSKRIVSLHYISTCDAVVTVEMSTIFNSPRAIAVIYSNFQLQTYHSEKQLCACDVDITTPSQSCDVTAVAVCSESARFAVAAGAAISIYDCRPLVWKSAPMVMVQFESPYFVTKLSVSHDLCAYSSPTETRLLEFSWSNSAVFLAQRHADPEPFIPKNESHSAARSEFQKIRTHRVSEVADSLKIVILEWCAEDEGDVSVASGFQAVLQSIKLHFMSHGQSVEKTSLEQPVECVFDLKERSSLLTDAIVVSAPSIQGASSVNELKRQQRRRQYAFELVGCFPDRSLRIRINSAAGYSLLQVPSLLLHRRFLQSDSVRCVELVVSAPLPKWQSNSTSHNSQLSPTLLGTALAHVSLLISTAQQGFLYDVSMLSSLAVKTPSSTLPTQKDNQASPLRRSGSVSIFSPSLPNSSPVIETSTVEPVDPYLVDTKDCLIGSYHFQSDLLACALVPGSPLLWCLTACGLELYRIWSGQLSFEKGLSEPILLWQHQLPSKFRSVSASSTSLWLLPEFSESDEPVIPEFNFETRQSMRSTNNMEEILDFGELYHEMALKRAFDEAAAEAAAENAQQIVIPSDPVARALRQWSLNPESHSHYNLTIFQVLSPIALVTHTLQHVQAHIEKLQSVGAERGWPLLMAPASCRVTLQQLLDQTDPETPSNRAVLRASSESDSESVRFPFSPAESSRIPILPQFGSTIVVNFTIDSISQLRRLALESFALAYQYFVTLSNASDAVDLLNSTDELQSELPLNENLMQSTQSLNVQRQSAWPHSLSLCHWNETSTVLSHWLAVFFPHCDTKQKDELSAQSAFGSAWIAQSAFRGFVATNAGQLWSTQMQQTLSEASNISARAASFCADLLMCLGEVEAAVPFFVRSDRSPGAVCEMLLARPIPSTMALDDTTYTSRALAFLELLLSDPSDSVLKLVHHNSDFVHSVLQFFTLYAPARFSRLFAESCLFWGAFDAQRVLDCVDDCIAASAFEQGALSPDDDVDSFHPALLDVFVRGILCLQLGLFEETRDAWVALGVRPLETLLASTPALLFAWTHSANLLRLLRLEFPQALLRIIQRICARDSSISLHQALALLHGRHEMLLGGEKNQAEDPWIWLSHVSNVALVDHLGLQPALVAGAVKLALQDIDTVTNLKEFARISSLLKGFFDESRFSLESSMLSESLLRFWVLNKHQISPPSIAVSQLLTFDQWNRSYESNATDMQSQPSVVSSSLVSFASYAALAFETQPVPSELQTPVATHSKSTLMSPSESLLSPARLQQLRRDRAASTSWLSAAHTAAAQAGSPFRSPIHFRSPLRASFAGTPSHGVKSHVSTGMLSAGLASFSSPIRAPISALITSPQFMSPQGQGKQNQVARTPVAVVVPDESTPNFRLLPPQLSRDWSEARFRLVALLARRLSQAAASEFGVSTDELEFQSILFGCEFENSRAWTALPPDFLLTFLEQCKRFTFLSEASACPHWLQACPPLVEGDFPPEMIKKIVSKSTRRRMWRGLVRLMAEIRCVLSVSFTDQLTSNASDFEMLHRVLVRYLISNGRTQWSHSSLFCATASLSALVMTMIHVSELKSAAFAIMIDWYPQALQDFALQNCHSFDDWRLLLSILDARLRPSETNQFPDVAVHENCSISTFRRAEAQLFPSIVPSMSDQQYSAVYAHLLRHLAQEFGPSQYFELIPDNGESSFFVPFLEQSVMLAHAQRARLDIERLMQQFETNEDAVSEIRAQRTYFY